MLRLGDMIGEATSAALSLSHVQFYKVVMVVRERSCWLC